MSTAYLAAKYLQEQGFKDKVYVIGSTGITQEMDMVGIKHTDIGVSSFMRIELIVIFIFY